MTETKDTRMHNVERVAMLTLLAAITVMTVGLVVFGCLALVAMSLWWLPVLACKAFVVWVVYNWMDRNL